MPEDDGKSGADLWFWIPVTLAGWGVLMGLATLVLPERETPAYPLFTTLAFFATYFMAASLSAWLWRRSGLRPGTGRAVVKALFRYIIEDFRAKVRWAAAGVALLLLYGIFKAFASLFR